ncbi:hypothetical protein PG994_015190 [Apiospora phragmitis]|uniref:Uncharacterized protein n=1 Tax=Apiospora phragmitis TaxID=2905665 RepID=A0ABR1SVT7_9PEZI
MLATVVHCCALRGVQTQLLQANYMAYLRFRTTTHCRLRHSHSRHGPKGPLEVAPYKAHRTTGSTTRRITTVVAKGEKAGKAHHDHKSLVLYANGSGYNGGVGAAAFLPKQATSRAEYGSNTSTYHASKRPHLSRTKACGRSGEPIRRYTTAATSRLSGTCCWTAVNTAH